MVVHHPEDGAAVVAGTSVKEAVAGVAMGIGARQVVVALYLAILLN